MAKEKFIDWNPTNKSLARLVDIRKVIVGYKNMGIMLTLRQLYYRLVGTGIIKENNVREYKNLGNLLSKARLAGLIDWDIIEDRGRRPDNHIEFQSPQELVEWASKVYRLDRWEGQENYVELWCEKDALSSVLQPITRGLHTTLMVNRGYSSQSAMHSSAQRFIHQVGAGQKPVLLYLGDFDPSGEDMVRDIRERLYMFGVEDLEVRKLALTTEQIEQYNPPSNLAKKTDSRTEGFIAKHGDKSYEVDALDPEVLQQLLKDEIGEYLDWDKWDAVLKIEARHKAQLKQLVKEIK